MTSYLSTSWASCSTMFNEQCNSVQLFYKTKQKVPVLTMVDRICCTPVASAGAQSWENEAPKGVRCGEGVSPSPPEKRPGKGANFLFCDLEMTYFGFSVNFEVLNLKLFFIVSSLSGTHPPKIFGGCVSGIPGKVNAPAVLHPRAMNRLALYTFLCDCLNSISYFSDADRTGSFTTSPQLTDTSIDSVGITTKHNWGRSYCWPLNIR